MKIIKFIEEKFWIPLCLASLLGLLFPLAGRSLSILLIPILMIIFLLTCLKIDFIDVIKHIKKPLFIIYVIVIYLVIIPIAVYYLFNLINPEIAIAILLLACMPPAATAPLLTDTLKGNISLSMAISLLASLVSPFTVLLVFSLLTQKTITLDLINIFKTLLIVNFVPLLISQLIRRINKNVIEKTKKYYSVINIGFMSFLTYIIIAVQAKEILLNPFSALVYTLWLYPLFGILFIISYFIGFWKNKSDKTAIAVTKTYMTNALGIGIAFAFFSPKIALLMVLSEIPWTTTLGPFKYLLKFLR